MSIYELINALLQYGKQKELYEEFDEYYVRNALLSCFKLDSYEDNNYIYDESVFNIYRILDNMIDYAIAHGIIKDSQGSKDLFDTKVMGCLVPLPSTINNKFSLLASKDGSQATDYFYKLCCDSNYIRLERINKDIHFDYQSEYGVINISINLAKPEKDPKDIKQLLTDNKVSYPKCMLCKENVNYSGRVDFPARQNLRYVSLTLNNKQFYLQYSPYSYYTEHCIVFSNEHKPMQVDINAINELVDFLDMFPDYFIGSNAGLPIVGGSILNHHHFQGGKATLPMAMAQKELIKSVNDVDYYRVIWPLSVIRLRSKKKDKLLNEASKVVDAWSNYSNKDLMIINKDKDGIHNSVTPIVRKVKNEYELDIVLRNNLTTETRPYGLFHPQEKYFHIKKENIGLIEVMGLAILPSRLKKEMEIVRRYMLNQEIALNEKVALTRHKAWADRIISDNRRIGEDNVDVLINDGIGEVFVKVLKDCGVFKEENSNEFVEFVKNI